MKIGEVIAQGKAKLDEILSKLSTEVVRIEARVNPRADRWPIEQSTLNFVVKDRNGQKWKIEGTALTRAYPSELKSRLFELSTRTEASKEAYPLIVAPFLSEESAKLCLEHNVGYLDLSGNCLINFGPFHIQVSGRPNKHKTEQSLGSLFSTKSSRVLRQLLHGPLRPHKVKNLAESTEVSLGLVSKVRTRLLEQLWAEETPEGIQITKPDTILKHWLEADKWSERTEIREYSTLISEQVLAKKLVEIGQADSSVSSPTFTLNFAAWLRAPHNVPTTISAYLESFPDDDLLREKLQARPVPLGAGNLRLIVPNDYKGITLECQRPSKFPEFETVSDLQLYLDLHGGERNGAEQAEMLRELEDFNGTWT